MASTVNETVNCSGDIDSGDAVHAKTSERKQKRSRLPSLKKMEENCAVRLPL